MDKGDYLAALGTLQAIVLAYLAYKAQELKARRRRRRRPPQARKRA